jgi:site-specific DNA recombinase
VARARNGPLRCAPYYRCSSDDQKHGDFTTVQAQKEINARYIAEIGGLSIGDYADEGRTGTNLKRPDWKRLLADAQAGKIDAVVVSYMSRLGRGEVFYIAEYLLKEAGIKVFMVKEQFTPDLAGYANKSMKIFLDGMYPIQVAEWTRTKMQEMVAQGFRCGGTLPFGYSTVYVSDPAFSRPDKEPPKRLVINETEAPFVVRAFEVFVDTGSVERVRVYLNSVTERTWTLNNAIYLLKNEAYRGILVFGPWRNERAFEAIIPEELWQQVKEKLATRGRAPKKDTVDKTAFFLRGLVWCEHCGNRMTPGNHHGRASTVRYYECIAHGKRTTKCPIQRVNAHSLHAAVADQIRRAAEHPTRMTELIREAAKQMPEQEKVSDQLVAVTRRLRDVEKKTKGILAAVEAGGAGIKSLLERLTELQIQTSALQTEKYQLEARNAESRLNRPNAELLRAQWQQVIAVWDAGTDEEKANLLPLIVNRVSMTQKERGLVRLSFSAINPRLLHVPTSENVVFVPSRGAGVGLEPTTFGL